jgi:hypothetical protein
LAKNYQVTVLETVVIPLKDTMFKIYKPQVIKIAPLRFGWKGMFQTSSGHMIGPLKSLGL